MKRVCRIGVLIGIALVVILLVVLRPVIGTGPSGTGRSPDGGGVASLATTDGRGEDSGIATGALAAENLLPVGEFDFGVPGSDAIADMAPLFVPPLPRSPDWIEEGKKHVPTEGAGEVRIEMKLIELRYGPGEEDPPSEPYQRLMNEDERQAYLREMATRRGAGLMTAPSVTIREGRTGHFEVGRPLRHPVDARDGSELVETNLGVSSRYRAWRLADGNTLQIDVFAAINTLKGFQLGQSGMLQPVIGTRHLDTSVEMSDGQTAVFGGFLMTDQQEIEESIPILGDLPVIGGVFRHHSTHDFVVELIIMVTPSLVPEQEP